MNDPHFQIKVNGKDREIKMTFGLLDLLARVAGDPDGPMMFTTDADLREAALSVLLSERDKTGRITKELNLFDLDVDREELISLLDWAGAHTLDFFLSAIEKAKVTAMQRKDRVAALQSTSTGGKD